jgi:hypothetical protein
VELWTTADVVTWLKECSSESNARTCVSLSTDYSELFERCGFDGKQLVQLLEWDESSFKTMWEEYGDQSIEPLAMSHRVSSPWWRRFLELSPEHKSVVAGLNESEMHLYEKLSDDERSAFLASPYLLQEPEPAEEAGFVTAEEATEEEKKALETQKAEERASWFKKQRQLATVVSTQDQLLLQRELQLGVKDKESRTTFWKAAEEAVALRPRLHEGQMAIYEAIHDQHRRMHPADFPKSAAEHGGEATIDHRFERTAMTAGVITMETIHQLMRESTEIQVLVERVYVMPELRKDSEGRIGQFSFLLFLVKIHMALIPDITEKEAHASAMKDWERLVPGAEEEEAAEEVQQGEQGELLLEEQWLERDLFHKFFVEVGWAWCDEVSGQVFFKFWLRVIRAISCVVEAPALQTDLMGSFNTSAENAARSFSGGVEIGRIAMGRKIVSKILSHKDEIELQQDEHLPLVAGFETNHRIICQSAPDSAFGLPNDLDLDIIFCPSSRPHLKFSLEHGWGANIARKRDLSFLPPLIRAMYADDPSAPVETDTAGGEETAGAVVTDEEAATEEDDGRHMPVKPNEVLFKKEEYSPEPHLKREQSDRRARQAAVMQCRHRHLAAHPRRYRGARSESPVLPAVPSATVDNAAASDSGGADRSQVHLPPTKGGSRNSKRGESKGGRGSSRGGGRDRDRVRDRGGSSKSTSLACKPRARTAESGREKGQRRSRPRTRTKRETAAAGWYFEQVPYDEHEKGLATECERSMDAAIALQERAEMSHAGGGSPGGGSPYGSPEAAPSLATHKHRPCSSSAKRVSTLDGQGVRHTPTAFTPHYYQLAGGDYGRECGKATSAYPSLPTLATGAGSMPSSMDMSTPRSTGRQRPRSARTPRPFPKGVALSMPVHPGHAKRTPRSARSVALPGLSRSTATGSSWDSPFLRQKKTPVWLRYQASS